MRRWTPLQRVARATALILAALALAPPAAAGDVASLGLDRAIETALANSHHLGIADAELGIAEGQADEARSHLRPQLEFTEVLSRSTNPAMVFANKLGQEQFGPDDFGIASLNQPDPLNNFQTRITLFQPVWTGGKLKNPVKGADLSRDAASSRKERVRQEVVQRVVGAYTAAVQTAAQLKVAEEARETARAHVKLTRDRREGGLVVESDLLQAQVRESELEEMVIRAASGLDVARARLNLTMGLDPMAPLALPDRLALPQEQVEPLSDLVQEAAERRPDLHAASSSLEAATREARAARAQHMPDLGILGNVEANSEDFLGTHGTNWTVMAAFRWSIFKGNETRARVAQANGTIRRAERAQELLRQSVSLDVIEAYHGLEAARQSLTVSRRAVEQGREGLRIVEDRYRGGLTTLVDLLEAETSLTRARAREVAAGRDVLVSRAALDLAVGRL
jgi:outer membrane protein